MLCFVLAACGGSDPQPSDPTSEPTTEATAEPDGGGDAQLSSTPPPAAGDNSSPAVNSIAVDPGDGTIIVGTGPALFRIDPGAKDGERILGQLSGLSAPATVSGNLVVRFTGPGELLASGHPQEGDVSENLPLMTSSDHGDTWQVVPDTVEADYHELEIFGDQLIAVSVESPDIQVSRDGGVTWEKRTPPQLPIDVVVDPSDPEHWAVSTEQGTFLSTNGGNSWRPRDPSSGARLAWPAKDKLYSLERNGQLRVSADGGQSFKPAGDVGGLPSEFTADGQKDELYVAVVGGKVRKSADGGKSWTTVATLK
ncbi:hypothetical protein OJ997_30055 [Solirubrobacter phytolaccae]|uniref:Exo-alpha-sialidase n=1 Tax=Solirubrobacter phytolaccae TaxID=1404360 RepID=A0A9X3NFY6_9ACTN|nr:hypothetical protein [Solirubrobacter phytolaccae]MDA0184584.1 hypothetical protein [Solirubrobacter phytolaccae]